MDQNTIAIIWDFDKTLINGYMQDPIFNKYKINSEQFWKEVNTLPEQYAKQGIRVNIDTIYLNHMITCVNLGIFKGLNNALLTELGKELVFYPGVIEIFNELKNSILSNSKYQNFGIHVEHYIVSTGLTAMIKGSLISQYVDGIWGCEFIENPIRSNLEIKIDEKKVTGEIQQIGYIIDNTSKTRAIFEINKGVNKFEYIDVNSKMDSKDRRVPFQNMIYIADGPSDVPVFSILQQYGGKTFAIYPKGNQRAFNQVDELRKQGRIDMYAEADYSKDTTAYMWLMNQTIRIADSIYELHDEDIRKTVKKPPNNII
jgi:Chromosome condensation complex Condensin, subunit G